MADIFSIREDGRERSISFMVVSRTGWPDVGYCAMEHCRFRPTWSWWMESVPAFEACAAGSHLYPRFCWALGCRGVWGLFPGS